MKNWNSVEKSLLPRLCALSECLWTNDKDKYEEFTDEDFSMIMKDIQYGIRKGWELLQSNKKIIELHCHSLCCCVALINYEIYKIGDINKITDLERLYLFFYII